MEIRKLPDNPYGALTLPASYIGKHNDGWEIIGDICEDYFDWVNDFVAYKHEQGVSQNSWVAGNFESGIFASSQEAYEEFIEKYPPEAWNYNDL